MRISALLSRVLAIVSMGLMLAGGAVGQEDAVKERAWQQAITGQIEAFRAGDAARAMTYAGSMFKLTYRDPDIFYDVIKGSGYGPILESTSHSFGKFTRQDKVVYQLVKIQGPNQRLYDALYTMGDEEDGWRVLGVILRANEGIGI